MSLTKKTLLAELACSKPEKLPEQLFGHDVYVRPVSEFQRSRRVAYLHDNEGKFAKDAVRKARMYTVIDHLCDAKGESLFDEKDMKDLLEMDALKLDVLINAIEDWVSKREGKIKGESAS